MLSSDQIFRYSRHILLPEIGGKGQELLLDAKVLIIGAGGLGSPVAQYIAAAGVGYIGIMDGDNVDLSNLQRQIIHNTADIGKLKVESAKEKINLLNPDVFVKVYPFVANAENIEPIINDYDLVIDCCDNFPTRYLVNDAAVLFNKPYFYCVSTDKLLFFIRQMDLATVVFFLKPQSPAQSQVASKPESLTYCREL